MRIRNKEIPLGQLPSKTVTHIKYLLQRRFTNLHSAYYLKKYDSEKKSREKGEVIKVGFIAQMPEVWDKQMDLFRFMLGDGRFDPKIIYVAHYDFVNKNISEADKRDKCFYTDLYGEEYVIDYFREGADLEEYDYLFYDRAYNQYLPKELRSRQTVKTNRICLINYTCRDFAGKFGSEEFAPDTYMWFASCQLECEMHDAEYSNRPFNHIYDVGYPAFETYHAIKTTEGKNRILWTPRWTYDEGLGESHFFEYIDSFIRLAEERPEVKVTIRPHPLMFDYLISKKMITKEEIERLEQRCADAGISFDKNRIIADTFAETDILVSDYSSIIKLYMAMEKPVVYCPSELPLNDDFIQLTNGM